MILNKTPMSSCRNPHNIIEIKHFYFILENHTTTETKAAAVWASVFFIYKRTFRTGFISGMLLSNRRSLFSISVSQSCVIVFSADVKRSTAAWPNMLHCIFTIWGWSVYSPSTIPLSRQNVRRTVQMAGDVDSSNRCWFAHSICQKEGVRTDACKNTGDLDGLLSAPDSLCVMSSLCPSKCQRLLLLKYSTRSESLNLSFTRWKIANTEQHRHHI